ncbi:hypothetical protein [Cyclobacterium qasimii]|uniref:Uncharacterized protein n=1 Tax=Cyclobacterium qasimii M12-11B TaxID=641524 RepID=S7V793_9BACT|nr:hypothetical protein [Cyclobacterium qasimii]EPR65472.1 hypothetical protein ADICYQ_5393 [Cyclobacterium qasimii M12-11B]
MTEHHSKYLTQGLFLLILTLILAGFQGNVKLGNKVLIESLETDSLRYDMFLLEDDNGQPEGYMAEIFTPVCHTNECYPVYVNFYWDLLGNYQKYDVPEGELLTKLDHVPFDVADHDKLQEILSNERSLLKDYKIEELVGGTQTAATNGVDAVTGATLKTIKNEVIYGAVYSCYTLWHLAHGDMAAIAKAYTTENYSGEQLLKFLESGHYPYQYWAIEKVLAKGLEKDDKIAAAMLKILQSDNIFLATHLIKVLPIEVFSSSERQLQLWETFENSQYRLQMDLLDKLNALTLFPEIHSKLLNGLNEANPAQQKKMLAVLQNQSNLNKAEQFLALKYLNEGKWESEMEALLKSQKKLDKKLKTIEHSK